MNVHVRASFTLFLSILRSPHPHCPRHHWATVEVVSGRGMMPNLTGVEPYLYSLHSRFCFKGFVYTRPINHLLPSHNPTAFKVGARLGDNVQHRWQCKSLFLLLLWKEMKIPRTSPSPLRYLYSLFFTLPLALIIISAYHSNLAPESSDHQTFKLHTPGHESACSTSAILRRLIQSQPLTDTALVSWQPNMNICRLDVVEQTLITPQETTGRDEDGGQRRNHPSMAPRTEGSPLERHLSAKCRKPQMICRVLHLLYCGTEAAALSPMLYSIYIFFHVF